MQKMYKIAVEYWENREKTGKKMNKMYILDEYCQIKTKKIVHSGQKV